MPDVREFYASLRHSEFKIFEASKTPTTQQILKFYPIPQAAALKLGGVAGSRRCHKVTGHGDNKLLPNRSHLGNASPKGGLAFFWERFIIIFLKLA